MTDILDSLTAALADRYASEEELGDGGIATVYLAKDLKHKRNEAVEGPFIVMKWPGDLEHVGPDGDLLGWSRSPPHTCPSNALAVRQHDMLRQKSLP